MIYSLKTHNETEDALIIEDIDLSAHVTGLYWRKK